MTYIANRSERVGIGPLTFDLVHGQPIPKGLPKDVIATLLDSQQIIEKDSDEREWVDPATVDGYIEP